MNGKQRRGQSGRQTIVGVPLSMSLGGLILGGYAVLFAGAYELRVLTLAGVQALLALGYQFIFGQAGALSLAQGAFFAIGAYTTGLLGVHLQWEFPATFPISILAPVAMAALVGIPVLRLESHYFALATLGLAQMVLLAAITWQDWTGGANGLSGVPGIILFGWTVPRGLPLVGFVWAVVSAGACLAGWLLRGPARHAFAAMREIPLAAGSIGIDAARLRFQAFLLGAGYAGAAGALSVHAIRVVSPEVAEFTVMVSCLTMVVIGGRGRIAGALAGALLLTVLPEWFRGFERQASLVYGIVLLAAIIIAPEGLIGAAESMFRRFGPARAPSPLPGRPEPRVRAGQPLREPKGGVRLRAAGLVKAFGGVIAVDGATLELRAGEILGVIGPNGSGKTTLVNLLSGLERPDAGTLFLADREVATWPSHRLATAGLARSFQSPHLVASMPVLDMVALAATAARGRGILGRTDGGEQLEALAILAELGLADLAQAPCGGLSQGQRRRVELARALALRPTVLLLDEPAAGLTPAEQSAFARELALLREDGMAMLVIEHSMPFLLPLVDRLICLDRGRILADGPVEDVRRDPAVIAAYLGTAR